MPLPTRLWGQARWLQPRGRRRSNTSLPPPQWVGTPAPNFTAGQSGSYNVTALVNGETSISLESGALPTGVTFNGAAFVATTQTIGGTSGPFVLRAYNAYGSSPSNQFSIVITAVAPVWSSTPSFNITEGQPFGPTALPVTVSSGTVSISWLATSTPSAQPTWISFQDGNPPTITFSGAQTDGEDINASMNLRATANAQTADRSGGSVTITAVNQPPVWGSLAGTVFNIARGGTLDLNDPLRFTDPDPGDTMTFSLVSGSWPSGVSLDGNTGIISATSGATIGESGNLVVRADDGYSASTAVTTFSLTSPSTQTAAPFMLGHAFAKGDVPSGQGLFLDETNARAVIKRRWNDGSVKHAIIVGRTNLTANVAKTMTVLKGAAPGGANLSSADIQTAAPTATIQCGSLGTVNLSSLLSSPFRTWITTPEMVECHYRAAVGATDMAAWFHVRLWAGGRIWIRAFVENGYLSGSPSTRTYTATVTIGGTQVYNASVTQHPWSRWTVEGWIGTNPQVTPSHNVTYMIGTKLVPNYWKRNPASSILNGQVQSYSPMQLSPQPTAMGQAGFGAFIGLQPNWAALYCTTADARAWRATMTASSALNTYSLCRRSSASNRIARPSDFPTTTLVGGGNGTYSVGNAAGTWELNHLVNEGFVAYLISGDYWHYETLAFNSSTCYFAISTNNGTGTNKVLTAETRGTWWMNNAIGHFCAIAPNESEVAADASVVTDYQAVLSRQATQWSGVAQTAGVNQIGVPYEYNMGAYGPIGSAAPWMYDFGVDVVGQIGRMEPMSSMTNWQVMRDYMYKWAVGKAGPTGSSNYHFSRAGSEYSMIVSSSNSSSPLDWYDSFGDVWLASFGSANAETTNLLAGTGSSDPAQSAQSHRWGPYLCGIAAAVEDGATGASAAWSRLTGATNWSSLENGSATPNNFNDTPIWGIVPRGFGGT